jgi:hypothetical protein
MQQESPWPSRGSQADLYPDQYICARLIHIFLLSDRWSDRTGQTILSDVSLIGLSSRVGGGSRNQLMAYFALVFVAVSV